MCPPLLINGRDRLETGNFGWTGNEGAILHVQFTGPAGIDYINPADDPRKKTQ